MDSSILSIEKIIGANGQRNLINGTAPGSGGPARFIIDLAANSLAIAGIPGLGTAQFEVVNFVDVNGTLNNDIITGNNKGNVFGGSIGKDIFDGGRGRDTVDYSNLGAAVQLERAGQLNKGAFGTDQINNVETIIGAVGFKNSVNGLASGAGGPVAFNANLSMNRLGGKNIPGLVNSSFRIKNFVNVTGTIYSGILVGDAADNTLNGLDGDFRVCIAFILNQCLPNP